MTISAAIAHKLVSTRSYTVFGYGRTTSLTARAFRSGACCRVGSLRQCAVVQSARIQFVPEQLSDQNNMSAVKMDPTNYPAARRDESVVDDFHGTKVADPYRWLEDPDSEETQAFVTKLNNISEPFMSAFEDREIMRKRLTELWDYPKYGCTSRHGDRYFYWHNSGLQNQSVLYLQESLEEKGRVFLDPNTLSDDGTTAVQQTKFSFDGSILAYGISEKGSDWVTLKFMEVPSGKLLDDVLLNLRHTGLAWTADGSGIFYSSYPQHEGVAEGRSTTKNEYHSLFFHRLGTPQSSDLLIADFPQNPEFMVGGEVSEDGCYLVVSVDRGCDPTNLLYTLDITQPDALSAAKPKLFPLFDKMDASYEFIDNDDSTALILTNKDAPMFKVIRLEIGEQNAKWEEVIPEGTSKLDWVSAVANDKLALCYTEDVKNAIYIQERKSGAQLQQLDLPICQVTSYFGRKEYSEIFYSISSFLNPGVILRADLAESPVVPKELRRISIAGVNAEDFDVEQVFYPSKDGTKIPMYIIHKKGLKKDGENVTILNGYGGFNVPDLPCFSLSRVMFMQYFNGIYALANLRGGSEYGEKWHEAGMKERKQNVFDDFNAAAEFLARQGYTRADKLCTHGGSNGGLLVAACANQRPELFGAVLNRVGVLDMLRYHKFTIGEAWVPEFGNPDLPADFEYIFKYSPLHNVRVPPETAPQLPPMLLMTADHDDRVVPLHTLKYTAELYERARRCPTQTNPLLVRVEVKAGHGAGKPTSKIIDEIVDMYSFVARIFGLRWMG